MLTNLGDTPAPTTKNKFYQFLHLLGLLLLSSFFLMTFANSNPFIDTHWLFDYSQGYIKRGLPGAILGNFYTSVTLETLENTYICLTSLIMLVFCCFLVYHKPVCDKPENKSGFYLLLTLWAVSAPGTLQQFAGDPGRSDMFGLLLIMIAFTLIISKISHICILLGLNILSVVSIMIHESNLVWVVPFIFFLYSYIHGKKKNATKGLILSLFLLFLFTLFTSASTYSKFMSMADAKVLLQTKAKFKIVNFAVAVHYIPLSASFSYTMRHFFDANAVPRMLIGGLVLIPIFLFCFFLVRQLVSVSMNRSKILLLLFTAFAPLSLLFIGIDQGRWLSMVNINAVFLALILLKSQTTQQLTFPKWLVYVFCIGIYCNFLLGSYGVMRVYERSKLVNLFVGNSEITSISDWTDDIK